MRRHILLYGFSIFAMFFGSGNLVYPLQVGITGQSDWLFCYLGFFCTGILLPFLGLFVVKLHQGSYHRFFAEAGSVAAIILPLTTLSLLGSFAVVPRCITVAHGGLEFLFPEIPLWLFSILFCAITFILSLKEQLMFQVLGKVLTPLLLVFLVVLIGAGLMDEHAAPLSEESSLDIFKSGFMQGYNTMDLLAAFFFSSLIFKQIEQIVPDQLQHTVLRTAIKPSLIGAGLLGIIYLGFVYLGAHYGPLVDSTNGELILPAITTYLMGVQGALVISVIIVLSCLTTAVALNRIYAKYLLDLVRLDEKRYPIMLAATTGVSFAVSSLDFNGIAAILGPILVVFYPALIALTILSIMVRGRVTLKMIGFYGVLVLALLM